MCISFVYNLKMNLDLACRICLVTDVKMFCLNTTLFADAYMELSGLKCINSPECICYECAALLIKYKQFRNKCLKANEIILNIFQKHDKITKDLIQTVDRNLHTLNSPLETYYNNEIKDCFYEYNSLENNHIQINNGLKETLSTIKTENADEDFLIDIKKKDTDNTGLHMVKDNDLPTVEEYVSNDLDHSDSDDDRLLKDYVSKKRKLNDKRSQNKRQKKISKGFSKKCDTGNTSSKESGIEDDTKLEEPKILIDDLTRAKKKPGPKFDSSYFEEFTTIVVLTQETAKQEVLLRKESSNYKNCRHKCELCYRGFEVQKTYENHMKKHSSEFGENECEFCHLRFPEQKLLCKHRLACHKRKFYCKICPYTCFSTNQAKTHIRLHKGKKYPCKECGEIFSMPNSLLMHKRVKHPTECVCPLCGSTFATNRGLRSHTMLLHRQEINEEKGPLCKDCDVHFANETAWKRHLVLSAKHKISNGCEYCGETFDKEENLKAHLRTHARKKFCRNDVKLPAACSICGQWLADRAAFRGHTLAAHPQSEAARRLREGDKLRCVCELCGKMFKKQCFLLYHQRSHSGERPYRCECGKAYAFPGALSSHRASHAARAPLACALCPRTYTSRSALNKHHKAHLGIRPHKCKICDKSFPNLCDVKLHTQYVHYKVPWPKRDRAKRSKGEPTETAERFLYPN